MVYEGCCQLSKRSQRRYGPSVGSRLRGGPRNVSLGSGGSRNAASTAFSFFMILPTTVMADTFDDSSFRQVCSSTRLAFWRSNVTLLRTIKRTTRTLFSRNYDPSFFCFPLGPDEIKYTLPSFLCRSSFLARQNHTYPFRFCGHLIDLYKIVIVNPSFSGSRCTASQLRANPEHSPLSTATVLQSNYAQSDTSWTRTKWLNL